MEKSTKRDGEATRREQPVHEKMRSASAQRTKNTYGDFPDVAAALALRQPRRIPVFLFSVNPYCASFTDVRYSDCMLDAQLYADCIVRMARHFRPDGLLNVGSAIDPKTLARSEVIEISNVRYLRERKTGEITMRVPDDGNPQAVHDGQLPAQRNTAQLPDPDSVHVPSIEELSVSDSLAAARRLIAELGDMMLISRGVCNGSNTVVNWLGLERTCLLMREDPAYVKALVERATEIQCAMVRAQARVCLRLFYTGGSWGSLFGPRDYNDFFAASQVRINQTIHDAGGLALLHLTGRQAHLVEANLASEPDAVLVDQDDLGETKRSFSDHACVAGQIDPNLLLRAAPDEIRHEVGRQVEIAGPAGFIVCTTDCIVKDTPIENVQAMIDAARGVSDEA